MFFLFGRPTFNELNNAAVCVVRRVMIIELSQIHREVETESLRVFGESGDGRVADAECRHIPKLLSHVQVDGPLDWLLRRRPLAFGNGSFGGNYV